MMFGLSGRATRNFLILLVSMHFILFIDRVNLAAAAPVMQKDLGLSNLALSSRSPPSTIPTPRFSWSGAGLPTASARAAR
jgi:hypothetical protein